MNGKIGYSPPPKGEQKNMSRFHLHFRNQDFSRALTAEEVKHDPPVPEPFFRGGRGAASPPPAPAAAEEDLGDPRRVPRVSSKPPPAPPVEFRVSANNLRLLATGYGVHRVSTRTGYTELYEGNFRLGRRHGTGRVVVSRNGTQVSHFAVKSTS